MDSQDCIYTSKLIFDLKKVPLSTTEPGRVSMSFSTSGNNLVLSNSIGKIVVYETKNAIKFDFVYDYQLKSF